MKTMKKFIILLIVLAFSITFLSCTEEQDYKGYFIYKVVDEKVVINGLTTPGLEAEDITIPEEIEGKEVVSIEPSYDKVDPTKITNFESVNCFTLSVPSCVKLININCPNLIKLYLKHNNLGGLKIINEKGTNLFIVNEAAYATLDISEIDEAHKPFYCLESMINNYMVINNDRFVRYLGNKTKLTVPSYIKTIEQYAFLNSVVEEIVLPNKLEKINAHAFENSEVRTIVIPESVTSIGEFAFRYCDELENITIPESITVFEKGLFWGTDALTTVIIPSTTVNINDYCFFMSGIKKLTLSKKTENIGSKAFSNCLSLKELYIPLSVVTMGEFVFDGSDVLVICEATGRLSGWDEKWWSITIMKNSEFTITTNENKTIWNYQK